MSTDYEDLEEVTPEEELDRGDDYDQDESIDEDEETVDDESEESDIDLDEEEEEEINESPKEIKIPKSRLDEVIRQREEAKERSLWLEAQLEKLINNQQRSPEPTKPAEPSYNFDEAEEKYVNLIIEGETQKASKLRAEIDRARQNELKELIAEITEKATSRAKSESATVLAEEKFQDLVVNFENKYKFLDADADDYNEEAVDTVNTLLAGYVAAGKSKAEGLKLAVNKVAPLYVKAAETKQSLGNKRKVEAGKKAAQAANSQPLKTKSVSTRQVDKETVNVSKMSEREFNQLTEKEKRILRGD